MPKRRRSILIALAALAAVVFVLNELAATYYLYWVYWWYDIMMHFLGGALIAGLASWLALSVRGPMTLRATLAIAALATVVIGVGWELFEYATGQYIDQADVALDTALDLIMDIIGAFAAAPIVRRMFRFDDGNDSVPIL